ncbi:MAG: hypothetical protein DWQ05_10970 [Calditrichaeota bacterium]|nr:MAG: hypothetical protein DWQ05_10970 [Calditrichota bacterium]
MAMDSKTLKKSDFDWRLTKELRRQALDLEPAVKSISVHDLGAILRSLPAQFVHDVQQLKKKLAYVPARENAQIFAFCSSVAAEGSSTLAHALTLAYALSSAEFEESNSAYSERYKNGGKKEQVLPNRGKTLLVDANLRSPDLHEFMNVPRDFGLVDYVEDSLTLGKAIKWVVPDRLALLTAGRESEFGVELFNQARFKEIFPELRKKFQTIVFDCPPVSVHPDIITFLPYIDSVILTVKSGSTNVSDILKTKLTLQQNGALNIGVVLNRFRQSIPSKLNRIFE